MSAKNFRLMVGMIIGSVLLLFGAGIAYGAPKERRLFLDLRDASAQVNSEAIVIRGVVWDYPAATVHIVGNNSCVVTPPNGGPYSGDVIPVGVSTWVVCPVGYGGQPVYFWPAGEEITGVDTVSIWLPDADYTPSPTTVPPTTVPPTAPPTTVPPTTMPPTTVPPTTVPPTTVPPTTVPPTTVPPTTMPPTTMPPTTMPPTTMPPTTMPPTTVPPTTPPIVPPTTPPTPPAASVHGLPLTGGQGNPWGWVLVVLGLGMILEAIIHNNRR